MRNVTSGSVRVVVTEVSVGEKGRDTVTTAHASQEDWVSRLGFGTGRTVIACGATYELPLGASVCDLLGAGMLADRSVG